MLVVHASDLHLGRPLWALPIHPTLALDAFRYSAFRTLGRLVDLCLAEHATFLLLSGDLVEGSVRDYVVGLRLVRELSRLEGSGTRVVWVRGNHDAENHVMANLMLPSHIIELGLSGVETRRFEDCGVELVGRSYVRRACFDNLLAGYPPKVQGVCTIGLLHTSGDGAISGDSYAPCRRSELVRKGYEYLALGHVHEPTVVSSRVAYSGCLQGRHFFESGARGCMLVRFDDGNVASLQHRGIDAVRFGAVAVDISNARHLDDVVGAVVAATQRAILAHPDRALVVRYRLAGAGGVERLLSTSPELRRRALYSVLSSCEQRVAVDGFWIQVDHPELAPIVITSDDCDRKDIH
jgi:DNA repair protein SbcD/Mre11